MTDNLFLSAAIIFFIASIPTLIAPELPFETDEGFLFYFGNDGEGAVFLDDFSVRGFTDDEIREFMKGTLVLSVGTADALASRGFASELGVTVASNAIAIDKVGVQISSTNSKVATAERVNGIAMDVQYGNRELTPLSDRRRHKVCRRHHYHNQDLQ